MKLSDTTVGPFHLYTVDAGRFKLDGGAMFGVVPKTLWNRRIEADEQNRIPMALRCLLIESTQTGRVYLVDNGIGTKFDDKMTDIYQIDTDEFELQRSLDHHGFTPDDITDLIFTHLHFDHCGGTTYFDESHTINHTFQNARYHITESHLETATKPNARETASFLKNNIEPIADWNKLNVVTAEHEYEDGLTTIIADGHTQGQQLPKIEANGETIVYIADLLPSHHHLSLPWIMGYDMRPLETLDEKKIVLDKAADNHWKLFLEHDVDTELIEISKEKDKYKVAQKLTLDDI